MLEGLLMPIVAALVMLAVLVAIPVIVVRSSIARRREREAERASRHEPGHGATGRHRGRRSRR